MLLGLLATFIVMERAKSNQEIAEISRLNQEINDKYAQNVSQKTDASALAKNGLRQLNINLPNFALISLKRATDINQNYRDGWLALGLAQFRTNDFKNALASYRAAEKLDPIYAKTYELLKIAYEQIGDAASAAKAEEKYDFLSQNPWQTARTWYN